jgi:putative transposase
MEQLFGWISDERMFINEAGRIVEDCWVDLPNHYSNLELDAFVVMPNHVHGILVILDDELHSVRAGLGPAPTTVRADFGPAPTTVRAGLGPAPTTVRAGLGPAPTTVRVDFGPAPTRHYPLSEIVRAFKSFSSRKINEMRSTPGRPVWQRNYYEHIIRDGRSLERIREYIDTNPQRWSLDRENPDRRGGDEFDAWISSFSRRPAHAANRTITI